MYIAQGLKFVVSETDNGQDIIQIKRNDVAPLWHKLESNVLSNSDFDKIKGTFKSLND